MKDYRLYLLDRFSGHIAEVREFRAHDDTAAIAYVVADAGNDPRPKELWHRQHKLQHWDEPAVPPKNREATKA